MRIYFDSSALVKLFLEEPGSDISRSLWNRAAVRLTGLMAYPEVRSGLSAARRDGRISRGQLTGAVEVLDQIWARLVLVGVDDGLGRHAGELTEAHALRAYDAVHLASALSAKTPELVLATWDKSLGEAALGCGLVVAPAL